MANGLDTISYYQTPEGVELHLFSAGPIVRGVAWGIDFGIRLACYVLLSIGLSLLGGVGTGLTLVGIFLIEWFYPVFFEVRSGMTPGKAMLGLEVVQVDGTPVGWSSSLIRNLLRAIDLLPFFNMVGLIVMLLNPRFQRLGDLAAGTLVVYRREETRIFTIPNYPSTPAPVSLKLEEQRVILDFCERATGLSEERRRELALLLEVLAGTDRTENRLLAFANWFLKGKAAHASEPL